MGLIKRNSKHVTISTFLILHATKEMKLFRATSHIASSRSSMDFFELWSTMGHFIFG